MKFKAIDIHINQYISGELTGNDLIEFEKLLAKDEALQQQIKVHQQIDEVLSENYFDTNRFNEADCQNELERLNPIFKKMNEQYFVEEEIEEKKEEKPTSIIRKLIPFVSLAAAAALLLFVFNPFVNQLSPSELADRNFQLYHINTSRDASDVVSDLENGQFAYQEGNYQLAFDYFNTYLTKKPNDPIVLLANGNCAYQLAKYDEAIANFTTVKQLKTAQSNAANWYLALAYLKKEKIKDAKAVLTAIDENSEYYAKAKELLKQL